MRQTNHTERLKHTPMRAKSARRYTENDLQQLRFDGLDCDG